MVSAHSSFSSVFYVDVILTRLGGGSKLNRLTPCSCMIGHARLPEGVSGVAMEGVLHTKVVVQICRHLSILRVFSITIFRSSAFGCMIFGPIGGI